MLSASQLCSRWDQISILVRLINYEGNNQDEKWLHLTSEHDTKLGLAVHGFWQRHREHGPMPSSVKPERLKYYKIHSGSHGQWYVWIAMRKHSNLRQSSSWETVGTRDTHPAERHTSSLVQSLIPIYFIYWYKLETAALVGVILHVKCSEKKAFWVHRWEVSPVLVTGVTILEKLAGTSKLLFAVTCCSHQKGELYREKLQFLPILKNSNFQLFLYCEQEIGM